MSNVFVVLDFQNLGILTQVCTTLYNQFLIIFKENVSKCIYNTKTE